MPRVFDFDSAILRSPSRSVVHGLRSDASAVPSYEKICMEHARYATALKEAGLAVDMLPPLEDFPDSVFVEDPALVFEEGAILLRPGAPSRVRERDGMRDALRLHFAQILELEDDEHVDGGDILVTPKTVFIGLSARTSAKGAQALTLKLASLGLQSRITETPRGILHLKTASSLLDEGTILVTTAMAASGVFADFRVVIAPAGEEPAANALRVNDAVFIASGFPRTLDLLTRHDYRITPLDVSETAKLDAGLSCMSLRWRKRT